ncbi:restriction endonuclease [Weissella confusa]|uniref:restriction endonuclease n=2 Tax=Weissella confusa TaxID=1583 RepID=UPI001436B1A4|nr:restriction endonuclease [Weissella confusa]
MMNFVILNLVKEVNHMTNIFDNYLQTLNLDIRVSGNGRWMDQKVTPDVLSLVAQTILDYSTTNKKSFSNRDLFQSTEFLDTVAQFFGKPRRASDEMENEYNKFTGQSLKTLSYAGLLHEDTKKRPYLYTILREDLLEIIAQSDIKSLSFLQSYIRKCLSDSDFKNIDEFLTLSSQTEADFMHTRDAFVTFEKTYTSINKDLEPRRILAKVINPLAFDLKKHGAKSGHISKSIIRKNDLTYDADNRQDSKKSKDQSRKEYSQEHGNKYTIAYRVEKAIRAVKEYNIRFNSGLSELGTGEVASQGHHMLPKSLYPEFADYPENIIQLSPNEHYLGAHTGNNTQQIDSVMQSKLLLTKIKNIVNAQKKHPDESPYDLGNLVELVQKYNANNGDPKVIKLLDKYVKYN